MNQENNFNRSENPESYEENEIEKLAGELKEEIGKGKAAYRITAKIPYGSTCHGYDETDDRLESYFTYIVNGKGEQRCTLDIEEEQPPKMVPALLGIKINANETGYGWKNYGDVLVAAYPLMHGNRRMTLGDYGIKSEAGEPLSNFKIEYPVDMSNPKWRETRRGFNIINFTITRSLGSKIMKEIFNDPKKIFEFLESIDPELMRISPAIKTPQQDDNRASGFVICGLSEEEVQKSKHYGQYSLHNINIKNLIPRF